MPEFVDKIALRNALYDADAITMEGVKIINQFPIANVSEKKIGKWVEAHGSYITPGGDPVWQCSECDKGLHVYGVEHSSYGGEIAEGQWVACPNCGAIMEE